MTGETLFQFGTFFDPTLFQVTADCDAEGTSSLSFKVVGFASGPYPGTFEASGTAMIGPQTLPPEVNRFTGLNTGPLESFTETFTIYSGTTTIRGNKTLSRVVPPGSGVSMSGGVCAESENWRTWDFFAFADYHATIESPTGTTREEGLSFAQIVPIYNEAQEIVALGFKEDFLTSQPAPDPCEEDDDSDDDGLDDERESLFGGVSSDADSDDDGTRDGDEDSDDDGEDDEDEDDDSDPCPDDSDGDGEDDEDEDD